MIKIECDFCGKQLAQYEITEDFQLMSYKSKGRICCEDCDRKWGEYELEIQKAEESHKESLEAETSRIKEKYFKGYSRGDVRTGTKEKVQGEEVAKKALRRGTPQFKLR